MARGKALSPSTDARRVKRALALTIEERKEREQERARVALAQTLRPSTRATKTKQTSTPLWQRVLDGGALSPAASEIVRAMQAAHSRGSIALTYWEIEELAKKLHKGRPGVVTNYTELYRPMLAQLVSPGMVVVVGRGYCDGGGSESLYALEGTR